VRLLSSTGATAAAEWVNTVDLRQYPVEPVLARVERTFDTRLDRATVVRKRRTVGAATDRGTWVRIELRRLARLRAQGWGTEAAADLYGVARPDWLGGLTWPADELDARWHADETSLVAARPITPAGPLRGAPDLPQLWWASLDDSLTALAAQPTARIATPDTVPITQARISEILAGAGLSPAESVVPEWTTAHADLNWANLTGPDCCLLDWEDWGRAPRGLDAANLWICSLAVEPLAERVHQLRREDLDSRSGQLAVLTLCTLRQTGAEGTQADALRRQAARLRSRLTADR